MPRVSPTQLRKARDVHKVLPYLLAPTQGSQNMALQELRWLSQSFKTRLSLTWACRKRHSNYPLQYLLGSQPFNNLEVLCEENVLIPRWETEEWSRAISVALERSLRPDMNQLNIVDLCSGTGCILLSLLSYLEPDQIKTAIGVDISPIAIELIKKNIIFNQLNLYDVKLIRKDINNCQTPIHFENHIDILTCNPPYIPTLNYNSSVSTSVKLYEPSLALKGDLIFYKTLLTRYLPFTDSFFLNLPIVTNLIILKHH
ncbi:hypothetical protein TBLA_0E03830 [Henningerozyma blattae CBS 6284]|uniref:Methyltransferase domain-containing protein n=1 Tax=Henningerozyma blattae (strain ATCC 34711 / CBS 6284 / DSM 70876 / NBRC 10599 / NRRL Y-10934 / UCD 77-7) TaxID=1071380 RepID=I2H4Y5_HENB6|nr:hypothetical protein TBLA_0E03830 [Tetrapisispora blattae CBS 6284]CCH61437.1 hypothetical protein TBLA_0E03830 [Tetrapisispora blattae CBS 6284]